MSGNVRSERVVTRMRYDNKPPTKYAELPEAVQGHLREYEGIPDEGTYNQKGAEPCCLTGCARMGRPADHRLWHCLKLWAGTDRGQKYMGNERAAQRLAELMRAKSAAINLLSSDVFTCADLVDCWRDTETEEMINLVAPALAAGCDAAGLDYMRTSLSELPAVPVLAAIAELATAVGGGEVVSPMVASIRECA